MGRLPDNPRTEVDSRKDESLFQVCEKSYVPDAEGRMGLYRYNYSRDNFCGNPGSRQHERPSLGGDLYHFKMAFLKFNQSFIPQFTKFSRHCASLNSKIISKFLAIIRNSKKITAGSFGF